VTALLFTVLNPVALVVTYIYHYFFAREEQGVALPPDDDHPGLYGRGNQERAASNTQNGAGEQRAPREVDAEAVWG
jgi:hypothetical protein